MAEPISGAPAADTVTLIVRWWYLFLVVFWFCFYQRVAGLRHCEM